VAGGKRTAIIVSVVAAALAGVAAVGRPWWPSGDPRDPAGAAPVRTAEVTRMTLVDYEEVSGEIDFGEVAPVRYVAQEGDAGVGLGLVTWLPAVGSEVKRGGQLFRVDDRPVVLLFGALPLYRTLMQGSRGADVRQFEENLRALGYAGFTVDDQFGAATTAAVRRWQKALGVTESGQIEPGRVVYARGAQRVAEHRVRIGDRADGDIVGCTGTDRGVTASVTTTRLRRELTTATKVELILPDGNSATGTVARIGPAAADDSSGLEPVPTVELGIAVADPSLLAGRQGSVSVRFVADQRPDAIVVPVVALVALAEGGYGVQLVEGSTTRYVAVTTGLFARGWVEITSGGLQPGARVVVPA